MLLAPTRSEATTAETTRPVHAAQSMQVLQRFGDLVGVAFHQRHGHVPTPLNQGAQIHAAELELDEDHSVLLEGLEVAHNVRVVQLAQHPDFAPQALDRYAAPLPVQLRVHLMPRGCAAFARVCRW